jgi:hypothetical protein
MKSAELADRLERARRSVAEGETHIQLQRDLLFRLDAAGDDTSKARVLLEILLKRQAERLRNLAHAMRQSPT